MDLNNLKKKNYPPSPTTYTYNPSELVGGTSSDKNPRPSSDVTECNGHKKLK